MVPRIFLERCNRSGQLSDVKDIVDAIIYLTEVGQVVTGEVLHVDGGAHVGKW
jgi:enoyl-[acyl-carrier-protein] reductase (NADH)